MASGVGHERRCLRHGQLSGCALHDGAPTVSLSPGSTDGATRSADIGHPQRSEQRQRVSVLAGLIRAGRDCSVRLERKLWPTVDCCCSGIHGYSAANGHADDERHRPGECDGHAADRTGSRRIGFGDRQRGLVTGRDPVDRQEQRISDFGNGESWLMARVRSAGFVLGSQSTRQDFNLDATTTVAGLRKSPFG